MRVWIIVFFVFGPVQVNALKDNVCYDNLGCFSTTGPFAISIQRPISVVPQSPEEIKFILLTRESLHEPQYLDATYRGDVLKVFTNFKTRPTKIIIHGFLDNFEVEPWMQELVDELLKYDDYNVIVVDWSGGNRFPYFQATANTRVVGAQEAKVTIAEDIHIIGHSLGAHTAGCAGEIIPRIGRISGLDPAGPNFRDLDRHVRLDSADALFVDVIHTDDSDLGFGTTTLSGHVDFFPNGGNRQPGCQNSPVSYIKQSGLVKGIIDAISCSHVRAIQFFKESIFSTCPFLAYPCPNEILFQNKQCETCGGVGCSRMGFHADKDKPPAGQTATYYLRTGEKEPFCSYHYTITVKLSAGAWSIVSGIASISITGDSATSAWQSLTGGKATTLNPGQTYTFYVDLPQNVGKVSAVSFWWQKTFSIFTLGQVFSLNIDGIDVYAHEAGAKYKICNNGQRVDSGFYITLSEPCSSD